MDDDLKMINENKKKQALRYAENLTLPTVIVVSANMGCNHCQQRVSQVISKMNGIEDCVVDVGKSQVIMRGLTKKQTKSKKKQQKQISREKDFIRNHLTTIKNFSFAILFHLFLRPISCFTT